MGRLPLILLLALLALGGCGGSSEETTAPAPLGSGDLAQEVRSAWEKSANCRRPKGASRWGCSVGEFRCQGVVSDRGWTISCAKPGQSVAFRVEPS